MFEIFNKIDVFHICFVMDGMTWGASDTSLMSPTMGVSQGCSTLPPMLFFNNLVKNLTVAGVLRKKIWFSLPVPKN